MTFSPEMDLRRESPLRVTLPVVVLIVLLTWVASAGMTYGILSTRIEWLAQRMDVVERQEQVFIQRPEYDTSEAAVTSRLDRIERKIDALR